MDDGESYGELLHERRGRSDVHSRQEVVEAHASQRNIVKVAS